MDYLTSRLGSLMAQLMSTACVVTVLGGCGNSSSIFRKTDLQKSEVIVTDAKQRLIVAAPAEYVAPTASNKPAWILCIEPSPDVASSLTNALSASIKSSVTLSEQFSDSVVQLGSRLATIQLLRDELADLCRSYANGAVSNVTYTLRLSKLDRKMVTLLATETGASEAKKAPSGSDSSNTKNDQLGKPSGGGSSAPDAAEKSKDTSTSDDASALETVSSNKSSNASAAEKQVAADVNAVKSATAALQTEITKLDDLSGTALKKQRDVIKSKQMLLSSALAKLEKDETSALKVELAASGSLPGQPTAVSGGQSQNTMQMTSASSVIQEQFLQSTDLPIILDACITTLDTETRLSGQEDLSSLRNAQTEDAAAKAKLAAASATYTPLYNVGRTDDNHIAYDAASAEYAAAQAESDAADSRLRQASLSTGASAFARFCADSMARILELTHQLDVERLHVQAVQVLVNSSVFQMCESTTSKPSGQGPAEPVQAASATAKNPSLSPLASAKPSTLSSKSASTPAAATISSITQACAQALVQLAAVGTIEPSQSTPRSSASTGASTLPDN